MGATAVAKQSLVPAPTVSSRRRLVTSPLALRVISLSTALAAWELIGRSIDSTAVPPFSEVVEALVTLISNGSLGSAFMVSVQALVFGFSMALVVGILVGLLIGYYREVDHLLGPYISALLVIPSVAYIPMIMIWFGFGLTARTIVIFEFAVLVIIIGTRTGIRTVDSTLISMGRSFNLSRRQLFTKVMLRAATPAVFAAVRLGLGRAIKGMVVAEFLITLVGLGGLVQYYGTRFQISYLLAVTLSVIIFALVLAQLLAMIDNRMHAWTKQASGPKSG